MSLFTLLKISRTRYLLGKKQVKAGTPGAVKVSDESRHWYAYRREGKKQIKVRLFTDKAASLSKMAKMNTALERGDAGMTDPRKEHRERGALEHLEEFLPVMRSKGKSVKDKDRKEAILRAFVAKLHLLSDLNTKAVDTYLAGIDGSVGNKKKHLSAISIWVAWLLKKDRMEGNPLDRIDVPTGGKKTKKRRALAVGLIQKLLDSTRRRPLAAFIERYGPDVRDEVRKKLDQRGHERALVDKTAVYTGLRLGEIASLRPCHLELNQKPFPRMEIPGTLTKNGQQARLLLVPSFAVELATWINATGKGPDDLLFHVPQASVRIMQKDLKIAGILYRTSQGDADFHSLRMTSNVMLGQAGIPARIRQLFMRHSDIRLTMATYDDESFLDLESAVKAMEKLDQWRRSVNEEANAVQSAQPSHCLALCHQGASLRDSSLTASHRSAAGTLPSRLSTSSQSYVQPIHITGTPRVLCLCGLQYPHVSARRRDNSGRSFPTGRREQGRLAGVLRRRPLPAIKWRSRYGDRRVHHGWRSATLQNLRQRDRRDDQRQRLSRRRVRSVRIPAV